MAFRFILARGNEKQETAWYQETMLIGANATAPTVMGQVRALFPDAVVSIERDNIVDAKDPNQALEDLKALKQ